MTTVWTRLFTRPATPCEKHWQLEAEHYLKRLEHARAQDARALRRLLEQRPRPIEPYLDYGGELHEQFAEILLADLAHLRGQTANPAFSRYAADLPTLLALSDRELASFDSVVEAALRASCELVYFKFQRDWDEWKNVALALEGHLEFVLDPASLLIFIGADDLIVKTQFLLAALAESDLRAPASQLPDYLGVYALRHLALLYDERGSTTLGYPLFKFRSKD